MKPLLPLAYLLLLSPGALFAQQPAAGGAGLLCWQQGRKLRWRDFQAKTRALPHSEAAAAYAAPHLTAEGVTVGGRHTYRVRVSFNQRQAWVQDTTDVGAAKVLAHEQLHFDLCELVGRQLRQRVAQAVQAGEDVFAPAFQQEVRGFLQQVSVLETIYDEQTLHGVDEEAQQQWNERVRRDLAALSRFQSTAATCWDE